MLDIRVITFIHVYIETSDNNLTVTYKPHVFLFGDPIYCHELEL